MTPILNAMDRFLRGEISASELIQIRFEIFAQNPSRIRLLGWTSLTRVPMPTSLRERKEGIRQKLNAADPEIVRRCVLAISMMDGWFLNRNTYSFILGEDGISLMTLERLKSEIDRIINPLTEAKL